MEREEFLETLGRFGLSEREGTFYLELLQRGPATAREIARRTATERVVAYRTLDGMQARGVLRATSERPRRYWPVELRTLFDQGLESRRNVLGRDEILANRLVKEIPQLLEPPKGAAPRYQTLQGSSAVYPQLREMVRRARTDLKVMITQRGLRSSYEYGLQNDISTFLRGGGRLSMLVESHPQIRHLLRRFQSARQKYPAMEMRELFPQPARVTIADDQEVLIFPVPDARLKGVEEMAIWTDNPDFVRSQSLYFTALWERAGLQFPSDAEDGRGTSSHSRATGPSARGRRMVATDSAQPR